MSKNKPLWALGLMSGTSLDGVDAAMLRSDGVDILGFGKCHYTPYSNAEWDILQAALGKWPADPACAAARVVVHDAHLRATKGFHGYDLVGFHGQTLAHDPAHKGTHQLGDGAFLAQKLRAPVAWDFRTQDVQNGGQGAPLAPLYHLALVRHLGMGKTVALINLGGVGNITYVDPSAPPEALIAFDIGPANAPLNDFIQQRTGLPFDKNGAMAAQGDANADIVAQTLAHPFFRKRGIKSLDRNDFAHLASLVAPLSTIDGAATLTSIIAQSCLHGVRHLPRLPAQVWITGGGRKNTHLMHQLQYMLDIPVYAIDEQGANGDMLEAQAFAFLGVRVRYGLPLSYPNTTGVRAPQRGGLIAF